jgi:hypothetical protein
MATLQPSAERRLAVASPMPLAPPVTTATVLDMDAVSSGLRLQPSLGEFARRSCIFPLDLHRDALRQTPYRAEPLTYR